MASRESESNALVLADGSQVLLTRTSKGARVTLRGRDDHGQLDIEISLTAAGPIIKARATALELDVERDLVARCDTFRLEAANGIELVSNDRMTLSAYTDLSLVAATGSLRARANDDLQLLGEQLLLNTDRQAPAPEWITRPPPVPSTVKVSPFSGDSELAAALGEDD